ncbi:S2-RNase [Pyrus ussuriensis x Pyrus communis]|uniref:S2-RNase n=1 Tax=Pyrus ussuriensis x Pyrus communis TaxID=2448454 RepID=A0A5N5FSP5_9ROSA|nr:S2-RNase [Pyrus ussuriensis x Pyrus communis]
MAYSSGPSSKRVQGEGYEKDKKNKRAAICVRYTSSAKSRYRITYAELVGYQKSDKVNKFRGVLERCPRGDKDGHDRCPDWDIDKTDTNLMKCIDVVFKYCFRELKFDVERDVMLNMT